jgi:hypothetical protein
VAARTGAVLVHTKMMASIGKLHLRSPLIKTDESCTARCVCSSGAFARAMGRDRWLRNPHPRYSHAAGLASSGGSLQY